MTRAAIMVSLLTLWVVSLAGAGDLIDALKAAHDQCGVDLTTPAGEYWCLSKDQHTVYRLSDRFELAVMSQGYFTDLGYFEALGVCIKATEDRVLWCNYGQGGDFKGDVTVAR